MSRADKIKAMMDTLEADGVSKDTARKLAEKHYPPTLADLPKREEGMVVGRTARPLYPYAINSLSVKVGGLFKGYKSDGTAKTKRVTLVISQDPAKGTTLVLAADHKPAETEEAEAAEA
jgi:hypothetical protein